MPEAFATVREASKRVLGMRPFDVQIMGAAALHLGNIAEMKTGEGKTLVAVLPSYLNALAGKGVHVVTVNDYLAKFQSEQMGRVHHFLGLTDRRDPAVDAPRRAPRGLRLRHHLRHQQRARLRLPARQHGRLGRGVRPARPQLRHRRRGRLDPHRRGADPAHHQRPDPGRGQVVRRVLQAHAHPRQGRRLRGRREEAHHLGARARHHQGRGPPRASTTSTTRSTPRSSRSSTTPSRPRSCSATTRSTSSWTARCSSSTSTPAASWPVAATTTACTRPSRPRRA